MCVCLKKRLPHHEASKRSTLVLCLLKEPGERKETGRSVLHLDKRKSMQNLDYTVGKYENYGTLAGKRPFIHPYVAFADFF